MTRLLALWTKETLALLRDRHGLAALFVMPIIFILVIFLRSDMLLLRLLLLLFLLIVLFEELLTRHF